MAASKTPKQVQVLAKYTHKTDGKPNGRISYLVRSSDGKSEYCTTLQDGHAVGCSCPSKRPCYHEKQLEQKEAGRPFCSRCLPVWAIWLVEAGVLVAPAKVVSKAVPTVVEPHLPIAMELPEDLKGRGKVAKSVDLSTKGNLNGNRGFAIMRSEVA